MHGQPILVTVDSDGVKGEFMSGSKDANWDFSTICHCIMSINARQTMLIEAYLKEIPPGYQNILVTLAVDFRMLEKKKKKKKNLSFREFDTAC